MITKMKQYISRHLTNLSGWRTDRNIIVIESDDWGSIRMPSPQVYKECLRAGYRVDKIAYERFDSLASEDDLELLFDLLSQYRDHQGAPAVLTANILTANPDFRKIKSSNFQDYSYELITETFKRYPRHARCLELWKEGKGKGVFFPQSHGREHLNVSMFMRALQQGDPDVHFAFKHHMPGSIPKTNFAGGNKYVETLRYTDEQDKNEKLSIILAGLDQFELLMGYRSETFTPPNYLWIPDFDASMFVHGVRFYQGRKKMIEPLGDGNIQVHSHPLGAQNSFGQTYMMRNASFEPALFNGGDDPVDRCLKDISTAFRMGKPAVISSHRLNYVGYIDENNRDRNLKRLEYLLVQILKKWPDVTFMNSLQLGNLMTNSHG